VVKRRQRARARATAMETKSSPFDVRRYSKTEANCEMSAHKPGSCGNDCRNDGKCGLHYNHCHYPDPECAKEVEKKSAAAEAERKQIWAEWCGSARSMDWPQYLEKRAGELRSGNQLFKECGTVGLFFNASAGEDVGEVRPSESELWEAHMQRYR